MREKLTKDGAVYKCSFEFNGWRCDKEATEAIHPDSMPELNQIAKLVAIHGRAMCEAHLQFFGV